MVFPDLVEVELLHEFLGFLPLSFESLLEFFLHLVQVLVTFFINFVLHALEVLLHGAVLDLNSQLSQSFLDFVNARVAARFLSVVARKPANFILDVFEALDDHALELGTLEPLDNLLWFFFDDDLVFIQFSLKRVNQI